MFYIQRGFLFATIILDAARGLVDKGNDVSTKNGDVPVSKDENKREYKGFFIKQYPSDKNESNTDDKETETTQKGFYRKPTHLHHRF